MDGSVEGMIYWPWGGGRKRGGKYIVLRKRFGRRRKYLGEKRKDGRLSKERRGGVYLLVWKNGVEM